MPVSAHMFRHVCCRHWSVPLARHGARGPAAVPAWRGGRTLRRRGRAGAAPRRRARQDSISTQTGRRRWPTAIMSALNASARSRAPSTTRPASQRTSPRAARRRLLKGRDRMSGGFTTWASKSGCCGRQRTARTAAPCATYSRMEHLIRTRSQDRILRTCPPNTAWGGHARTPAHTPARPTVCPHGRARARTHALS